jgi:hypothetical protein
MTSLRHGAIIAVCMLALPAIANAAPAADIPQIISAASGMTHRQIETSYPAANCEGDHYCEFETSSPVRLCPAAAPCSKLVLTFADGRVVGYTADLSVDAWTKSLNASTAAYGAPTKKGFGPTDLMKARVDRWSWRLSPERTLTYTTMKGTSFAGAPVDAHTIIVGPNDE